MNASACLSDEILQALLLGKLSDDETHQCQSHLLSCDSCGARSCRISASDPLLELLPMLKSVNWSEDDEREAQELAVRFSDRSQLLARTSNGASLETEQGALHADDQRQAAAETPTQSSLAASGLTTLAGTPGEVSRGGDSAHTLVLPVGEGVTLGVYRLEKKLGEGGMGTVWKAFHTRLKKPVALKVLSARVLRNASLVARFEREMEAVGKLDHPVIVRAMDAGEIDRTHYLVMEYVEGTDFGQLVKAKGARTVRDACEMIRQAAVGLAYAHQNGLVHRDIKPTNLFLTKQGKVKVLDLGLARLQGESLADEGGESLTNPGQILGTPDFMAPEQWENTHTAGPACDLYALGCTLFFLLTGRAPFADERHPTLARKMLGHCEHAPPSLSAARAALMAKARQRPSVKTSGETAAALTHDIPPELEAIYEKLLAKSPTDRFLAAEHLASALAEILKTMSLAPAKPASPHAKEPPPASPGTDSAPPAPPRNVASCPQTAPDGPPVRSRRILRTMFGGLAAAFLLGVIVITIKNKDGSVKTLEVDDSSEISMSRQERPGIAVPAVPAVPVPSAPAPRPTGWVAEVPPPEIDYAIERKVAEGLIELRKRRQIKLAAWLRAAGSTNDFDLPDAVEALPADQFTITGVWCASGGLKDDDLAAIARCKMLERLRLISCAELTGAGLRQLEPLKSLQVLELNDCKHLGDGTAALIAASPNLRDVTVMYVEPVSDLTAPLIGCHRLEKLVISGPLISPALYPGLAEQCRDLESLLVSEAHGVDLPALASLRRLKTLRITGEHLTPERREASLAALLAMPALETLDCCPPMSDEYLALLTPLGKKLRHLEVNSWFEWDPGVTAAGWNSIKEFQALESLVISGHKSQVDGAALLWMATLPSLRSLNIGLGTQKNRLYSEADIAEFQKRRPDVQLRIDGTQYPEAATSTEIDYAAERKAAEGLIELLTGRQIKVSVWLRATASGAQFDLPQSREALPADAFTVSGISWSRGGLGDADLAAIARCRNLERLHVIECPDFTDAGLSQLRPLKNLKVLEINSCKQLGPGVAPFIAANPNLNVVMVDWSGEAVQLEEAILGCRHLQKLSVAESAITPALYSALPEHCPDLETLVVTDPHGVDLPALVRLPRLSTLRISGEHLTPERREASLAALLAMPALETLDCCPPTSDDYLAQLTPLGKKLRRLEVNSWTNWDPGVSVQGWKSIEKFESLESLAIRGQMSKLDGPALMRIANLPALRALEVQLDTKENRLYTEADIAEFQKRRPDVELTIDGTRYQGAATNSDIDFAAQRTAVETLLEMPDVHFAIRNGEGEPFWFSDQDLRGRPLPDRPFYIESVELVDLEKSSAALDTLSQSGKFWGWKFAAQCRGDCSALDRLPVCPQLQELWLSHSDMNDGTLQKLLTKCPDLKSLGLLNTPVTDVGFASLEHCPLLTDLGSSTHIGDDGLKYIVRCCPRLRSLNVGYLGNNIQNLQLVEGLPELRQLTCVGDDLTPEGVAALARMSHLEGIQVEEPTPDVLSRLMPLRRKLRSLFLRVMNGPELSDPEWSAEIGKFSELEVLDLAGGVAIDLDRLLLVSKLPRLKGVLLHPVEAAPWTPDEYIALLRKQRPDVRLFVKGKGDFPAVAP